MSPPSEGHNDMPLQKERASRPVIYMLSHTKNRGEQPARWVKFKFKLIIGNSRISGTFLIFGDFGNSGNTLGAYS